MVNWLCIKIVVGVNKKFIIKAETKLVTMAIIVVNRVDEIDKFNGVNKHIGIVLS